MYAMTWLAAVIVGVVAAVVATVESSVTVAVILQSCVVVRELYLRRLVRCYYCRNCSQLSCSLPPIYSRAYLYFDFEEANLVSVNSQFEVQFAYSDYFAT